MYEKKIPVDLECGINVSMTVLSGKWKPCIIDSIRRGIRRPGELHAAINYATPKVINMQLRELEAHGMICKKVYAEVPLRVEYYLTEKGESILPVIAAIDQWGNANKDHVIGALEMPHQ